MRQSATAEAVSTPRVFMMFGLRGMGKTSLVKHLIDNPGLGTEAEAQPPFRARVDFGRMTGAEEAFSYMAGQLEDAYVTYSKASDGLVRGTGDELPERLCKSKEPFKDEDEAMRELWEGLDGLKQRGVTFQVCDITLRNRKLTRSKFIPEATFVPSGVAEITRLQQREGYAYLRP